nr:trypsin-like peptidase domain-containing protein [Neorhizobium tomejilense]
MANDLVAGANAPLVSDDVPLSVRSVNGGPIDFAVAVLPIPSGSEPWLPLQDPPPAYAEGATTGCDFTIRLQRLPASVETVVLVLYTSGGATTLMPLDTVVADVAGYTIRIDRIDLAVPCIVFAELYRRNGAWKVRAKKDGMFDGIEELGRRLGLSIVDRRQSETPARHEPAPHNPSHGTGHGRADWTGSGFLVSDTMLVTNAHVVEGARSRISVGGFSGRTDAEPVIVDETNDLALLRLGKSFGTPRIGFRDAGVYLGEQAHAIGYPLAGLLGRGPQFTSGSVSNLLGPGDDARLMQVTCPIQPGSSGGPVFDEAGNLIAVITATLSNAQNVNFAIRSALVLPLLDAANVGYERREKSAPIPVSEIVRANSPAVWRVECFR